MEAIAQIALPVALKAGAAMLVCALGVALSSVVVPFIQAFGPWLTNWIEIPGLSVFILWGKP